MEQREIWAESDRDRGLACTHSPYKEKLSCKVAIRWIGRFSLSSSQISLTLKLRGSELARDGRKEIDGIVAKKGDRRDFSGDGDVVCTAEIGR